MKLIKFAFAALFAFATAAPISAEVEGQIEEFFNKANLQEKLDNVDIDQLKAEVAQKLDSIEFQGLEKRERVNQVRQTVRNWLEENANQDNLDQLLGNLRSQAKQDFANFLQTENGQQMQNIYDKAVNCNNNREACKENALNMFSGFLDNLASQLDSTTE